MRLRHYLLVALVAFVLAVTGSDVVAKMAVSRLSASEAVSQHLQWASLTLGGIVFLFVPYVAVAVICSKVNKRARTRSAATLFAVTLVALSYFYFGGFYAAQQAMVAERWTAATLAVGLLPFFVGVPILLAVAGAGYVATRLDGRPEQQNEV